jgi:hypothetical protein
MARASGGVVHVPGTTSTVTNRRAAFTPPHLSFHPLFQFLQTQRFQVSDHGAAHECCTAYFDQTFTKTRFETKLIATEASCSMRAVQRIRLKSQQSEMPTTPRTNGGGGRPIMPTKLLSSSMPPRTSCKDLGLNSAFLTGVQYLL